MGFRYIGSKTRIVSKIVEKISSVTGRGSHITDLMCGTGVVSAALSEKGFTVTAVDIMTYAYHHTRVQLLLNNPPNFKNAIPYIENARIPQTTLQPLSNYGKIIDYFNHIKPVKGYFWKEFSPKGKPKNTTKPRKYFTSENAAKIDGARLFIRKLQEENALTDLENSLLLHDLIMAANDVANIAGTYGHYLSKFGERAAQPIRFTHTKFIKKGSTENHEVIQGHAEKVSNKIRCDLCYIDPPYLKRQYAANYHILETLARGDEPEAAGASGLRPWRDQYSNFCSKLKIHDSFKKIFLNMKCPNFLISYSEDGLLGKEELIDFFSKFGQVESSSFSNKRFKSNGNDPSSTVDEYLFHIKK